MPTSDYGELLNKIIRRYGGATPEAFEAVLCPLLIPIRTLDKTIIRIPGQSHYRASFTVEITDEIAQVMQVGRTGKFVPATYNSGGVWREIAKGRIISVDYNSRIAEGEIYVGSNRNDLEIAINTLNEEDLLEVDQYGAAAKVLSGLVEHSLALKAQAEGYNVYRMPEDLARHLGAYYHYDFVFQKNGISKKVEVKSLWGTNTKYARLIHSKGGGYLTSSCKFATQDFFAVSLFLRTGNIHDFAFARSVSQRSKPYGLPEASNYPEYVHQNPKCEVGDGRWFATIEEVWNLE